MRLSVTCVCGATEFVHDAVSPSCVLNMVGEKETTWCGVAVLGNWDVILYPGRWLIVR